MRSRLATWAAVGVAAGVLAWLPAPGPAAAADEQPCDPGSVPGTEPLAPASTDDNPAHERMGVSRAHDLATGRGTRIAVIDSGIAPVGGLKGGLAYRAPDVSGALLSGHGTIVASLIAGEHGVAPDAEVFDFKVYDLAEADTTQAQKPVTSGGIVAGIRAVIAAHDRQPFDVVNISLAVRSPDPELERAIDDLLARDVVVVASAGNKITTDDAAAATGTPGNDTTVYPADYDHPGLVAVSAAVPEGWDPSEAVVPNLDTDVAAPTVGAIAHNATGPACVISEVATSWAAAEVSGVVALLRERFPDDNAGQVVARLLATTEGSGPARGKEPVESPWTGAGVVQAHDALTRELDVRPNGKVRRSVTAVRTDAQAPPPPARIDPFGTSRALLLWFGLLGGALLALVMMLRPLLRR